MANRDGCCRICGWGLGGPKGIWPATLAVHLAEERYCREGYLEIEAAERVHCRLCRHPIRATLHIVQRPGYLPWRIVGLLAGGGIAEFSGFCCRREAEELLGQYRFSLSRGKELGIEE